jgi:hypothetical protein
MLSEPFGSHRNLSKVLTLYHCTLLDWCAHSSDDVGTSVHYVSLVCSF